MIRREITNALYTERVLASFDYFNDYADTRSYLLACGDQWGIKEITAKLDAGRTAWEEAQHAKRKKVVESYEGRDCKSITIEQARQHVVGASRTRLIYIATGFTVGLFDGANLVTAQRYTCFRVDKPTALGFIETLLGANDSEKTYITVDITPSSLFLCTFNPTEKIER